MLENVNFTKEDGTNTQHDVTVFALSTCGFCARGLAFLRDNKIKFKFVYMDKIDFDIKEQIKKTLQDKYKERVVFPYLVLDETTIITGFVEDRWKEVFGIK